MRELVGRPGVFLLAPPGSSRGYMLERLLREDEAEGAAIRAYAYPRLAGELRARGLAVEDLPSAEELGKGAEERVVVAVESSIQAVELKERLGKRAELIYLPKLFKEAAKDVDKKLLEVAEVEHRGLGAGISPKLLRPGEAEELRRGRDALLALSPGAVGFRDVAKEALVSLRFKMASALLAELLAPAFAVSAVLQAADPRAAAPLVAFLAKAAGVGREELAGFAARLLELLAGRRKPRDKVVAGFAGLVRRALDAEPYVDDDRYEAVVDQVALEWGMDVAAFKALVGSLAALARGELVTKEELSRELAQHVKGGELEKIEEAIRQLVEGKLAEIEKRLEEVRRGLDGVEEGLKRKGLPIRILSVEEVEAGQLYDNFRAKGGTPAVSVAEGVFRLVETSRFKEVVQEVLRRLATYGVVVLRGPKGVGKSTLAAYAAWLALRGGVAGYAARIQKMERGQRVALRDVLDAVEEGRLVAVFDPSPLEFYIEPGAYAGATQEAAAAAPATLEELLKFAEENRGRGLVLAVIPDDLYEELDGEVKRRAEGYVLPIDLRDAEFLTEVIYEYSGCRETPREKLRILAGDVAQFDGGYTLAARYAGLWLRSNGCSVGDIERTVEASRKEPKLFFAHYIWRVLLRGSGDLAMQAAVPLLLHAYFGPVPVGVTYVAKAADEGGRWRLSTPEGLEGDDLQSLKKDALEPIANWLAQRHEDLVEEALKDLVGLNGEEAREQYREDLGDLIERLDWARGEVLKEGDKVLAELGIQEKRRGLGTALLLLVARRLAAVFKSGESRRCWRRVAFIAGHALAGYPKLPKRKQFPKGVAKTLGDSLKSCAVDDYLTIDGKIPPLSIYMIRFPYYVEVLYARDLSRIRKIREKISVLSPLADAVAVNTAKKTAEELLARWRREGSRLAGAFYVLGLAALAAEAKVDGKTAKLLLYVAPFAIQGAAHSAAVLSVLAALRPLGEKAPHRYVVALTAASEPGPLGQKTVQYIYDALRQFRDRLLKTKRFWPLVEAIVAYSNLLRNHSAHIKDRWKETVADMCRLYGEVRRRSAATTPDSGLSAQRLLDAVARAYVLAVALESYDLALHVKDRCGLSDFEREVEAVRSVLDKAAARPEELKIIMENEDFADWVRVRNITRDAGFMVRNFRSWFMYVLTRYKLSHALDDKGELDEKKLEETAEEFKKVAEMRRELEDWGNYLIACGLALKARVLVAKNLEELLERAKGFWELWSEAEEHLEPTAINLATAAFILGECLVYLAASGNKEMAEELLKKSRWLLDYDREVSVVTRLMLRVLGVGEGARQEEVVDVFKPRLSPEFRPALLMLAGPLQKDEALEECDKLSNALPPKPEACVNAVAAAAGDREAAEMLRSVLRSDIEELVSEARLLLGKADGRTLVEVLAPIHSLAQFAFTLLAAVEGRIDAVKLHGLRGSARFKKPLPRRLFRAVYENCDDLNSEGCRMALLKLYYYHL
ncbi:hypothetical protein B7L68_01325 [Thermoproteus sp. CP80]|nr:hypothetical protein B7L68_01325 [Thermoproteus sp. CP80]